MSVGLDSMEMLEHVKSALLACYSAVTGKGAEAKTKVDTAIDIKTVGDLAARQALLDYFKASRLPVIIYSEEFDAPKALSQNPVYSVVADEIDGTYNFYHGLGMLPCGSIVGISSSKNPTFGDFLCCGFLEFNSGNLFYAVKGKGAYVIEGWAKGFAASKRLMTSGKKKLDEAEKILLDFYMLSNLSTAFIPFGKQIGDYRSFATHMSLLANGYADLFVSGNNCRTPKKIKTGEELGPLYLLVKEAGGAVLDWKGNDLGAEEVGIDRKKAFHVIVAASDELGNEFAEKIKELPDVADYLGRKLR